MKSYEKAVGLGFKSSLARFFNFGFFYAGFYILYTELYTLFSKLYKSTSIFVILYIYNHKIE